MKKRKTLNDKQHEYFIGCFITEKMLDDMETYCDQYEINKATLIRQALRKALYGY